MVSTHPTSGDLFYLRLLLKNRPGALSFDDLKTVDGILHDDFQSACAVLNLCEDDYQWIECLQESVTIAHTKMIRRLFCNIALFCMPANPGSIYSQLKDEMSSDFLRRRGSALNLSQDEVRQVSYNDLLLSLNDEFER